MVWWFPSAGSSGKDVYNENWSISKSYERDWNPGLLGSGGGLGYLAGRVSDVRSSLYNF